MPKRSDIEAQIAKLQADLDGADTDDEIWLQDGSGPAIKVTGKRATTILSKYAHLWEEATGDDDQDGDEGEKQDEKPAGGGYFGKRKA